MVSLDIYSDPVCPWCAIGKANLDRALARSVAARGRHPFTILWHPFQLNPDMPSEGADRRSYLEARLGGPARAAAAYANVLDHAARAGVTLALDRIARIPNTVDAHRLIHWAGIEDAQDAVVTAIFNAYWQEGRDIGASETLCDIARDAGLDASLIARLLASNADREIIRDSDARARAQGMTGVPTFIVGRRHAVSGAQPAELWDRVITEILAAGQAA
jgi:predicted DsbA family dithiol-disulfide isomerase